MMTSMEALKATEKEISIEVPWGKVAALTWGDAANSPIMLCHGKMDVASGFRPLVSLLPKSFYYVSIELPGNGHSDRFPKWGRYTTADCVPVVLAVKEHFKWDTFMFIGHSLGCVVGKYFNIAYPGVISRMVELDPVPAYDAWVPKSFDNWYHNFYGNYYSEGQYQKYNASDETAPKYTYQKTQELIMNTRFLNEEAAAHILERCLKPAGDGLYRFTFDQRQKEITRLPLTPEFLRELYTSVATPTFILLADQMIKMGAYFHTPFMMDEAAWPNRNVKVKVVKGTHDVHIYNPECMSEDLSKFLMDSKAKL